MNDAVDRDFLFKIGDDVQIRIPIHKCVTRELIRANFMIGNIAGFRYRPVTKTNVYDVVLRDNSVHYGIPEEYICRLRDCSGTVTVSNKLPYSARTIPTEYRCSDITYSSYTPSSVTMVPSKFYAKYKNEYFKPNFMPKKIIYNDPATIVFWQDGTKTVVKRSPSEQFNKYNAFCAALAKRIFENNSQVNKIVQSGIMQKPEIKGENIKVMSDKAIEGIKRTTAIMRRKIAEMKAAERVAKMQRIMELKKKHHLSYAEIAKRMDIPESTVRNLVKEMKELNKDG